MPDTTPAPFLLPKRPGFLDQSLCISSRNAVIKFLQGTNEGPPNKGTFITPSFVCPYVDAFELRAIAARDAAQQAYLRSEIPLSDPIIAETSNLLVKATWYKNMCDMALEEEAKGINVNQSLWESVVAPLFYGSGFDDYTNPNSPWVDRAPDYCWPTRVLGRLGYAVNVHDELKNLSALWDAVIDVQVENLTNIFGSYESIVRWKRDHIDPVIELAEKAKDASLDILEDTGDVSLSVGKAVVSGFVPLLLLAGLGYFAWKTSQDKPAVGGNYP